MLASTMSKMPADDDLPYIALSTAEGGFCAASPGYPTELPALSPPLTSWVWLAQVSTPLQCCGCACKAKA